MVHSIHQLDLNQTHSPTMTKGSLKSETIASYNGVSLSRKFFML